MLIQNVSNTAQAPQPARPASDGAPDAVVAAPSNVKAKPGGTPDLPQTAAEQVAEPQPSAAQLQHAVDNINKALKQANRNLEFSVDNDTRKPVVKLVDSETGDVIRQFPSEEALAIARSIDQMQQQGMLLKQQA